jgi:transposase
MPVWRRLLGRAAKSTTSNASPRPAILGCASPSIQLGWLRLQHQSQSALARWFEACVAGNGGRLRKSTIVALARKLLVALWKYVNAGVAIEGAVLAR